MPQDALDRHLRRSWCATRSRRRGAKRRSGTPASSASKRFACRCCARGCRRVGTPLVNPTESARRAGELPLGRRRGRLAGASCARRSTTEGGDVPRLRGLRVRRAATSRKAARTAATRSTASTAPRSAIGHERRRRGRRRAPLRATRHRERLTLDAAGGARATVKDSHERPTRPRDLVAELEYRDPNGETLTAATRVAAVAVARLLGIKPDGWARRRSGSSSPSSPSISRGKPLAGVRVRTDAFKREYLLASAAADRRLLRLRARQRNDARRRHAVRRRNRCAGPADLRGRGARRPATDPARAGDRRRRQRRGHARRCVGRRRRGMVVRRVATTIASTCCPSGSATSRARRAVAGAHAVQGGDGAGHGRARRRARCVRATVVARDEPMLEVPMKGSYAPNVFVSALLVRGRIGGVAPTAMVDLAKPRSRWAWPKCASAGPRTSCRQGDADDASVPGARARRT